MRWRTHFFASSISESDIITCCFMNEGRLFVCAVSEFDSSYFFCIMFGDVIKNLLTISGHVGQLDSSLALQNIHAGHPLTTTFLVTIPSIGFVSTNGYSISSLSCDKKGFSKSQSSGLGGSKNTITLPFRLITVLTSSSNASNSSSSCANFCSSASTSLVLPLPLPLFFSLRISFRSCLSLSLTR